MLITDNGCVFLFGFDLSSGWEEGRVTVCRGNYYSAVLTDLIEKYQQ